MALEPHELLGDVGPVGQQGDLPGHVGLRQADATLGENARDPLEEPGPLLLDRLGHPLPDARHQAADLAADRPHVGRQRVALRPTHRDRGPPGPAPPPRPPAARPARGLPPREPRRPRCQADRAGHPRRREASGCGSRRSSQARRDRRPAGAVDPPASPWRRCRRGRATICTVPRRIRSRTTASTRGSRPTSPSRVRSENLNDRLLTVRTSTRQLLSPAVARSLAAAGHAMWASSLGRRLCLTLSAGIAGRLAGSARRPAHRPARRRRFRRRLSGGVGIGICPGLGLRRLHLGQPVVRLRQAPAWPAAPPRSGESRDCLGRARWWPGCRG